MTTPISPRARTRSRLATVAVAGALALTAGPALAGTAAAAPADRAAFPEVIELPDNFAPEGIASVGTTAYAGSLADGTLVSIDTRTGEVTVLAEGDGTPSVGLAVSGQQLFVAGGPDGDLTVVDRRTGETLADYQLIEPGTGFVNDVIVGTDAAYATESQSNRVFVIPLDGGEPTTLELVGDYEQGDGSFGLNGITTALGGGLYVVNSTTGTLYQVDTETGVASEVDVTDADGNDYALTNGDGMLRVGNRLYVVQNSDNQVAEIRLSGDGLSGTVVQLITSDEFNVPTTVAATGNRLYLPNAKFGQQTADYEVVRVSRR